MHICIVRQDHKRIKWTYNPRVYLTFDVDGDCVFCTPPTNCIFIGRPAFINNVSIIDITQQLNQIFGGGSIIIILVLELQKC